MVLAEFTSSLPFLLSNSLEWITVGFLINEPAGVGITFRPTFDLRIEGLRTVPHRAFARSITGWWICGHSRF